MELKNDVLNKRHKATYSVNIRYVWCKNAGENKNFKSAYKQEGMEILSEYTTPGTPQQTAEQREDLLLYVIEQMLCLIMWDVLLS